MTAIVTVMGQLYHVSYLSAHTPPGSCQGSVIYRAKSLNGLKKHGVLAFSVWWCYNSMHGASGSPDLRR